MSIINDLILSIVLVLFPLTVYFIYNCYENIKKEYNNLFFKLSLITSLYLCLRYGNIFDNYMVSLLCNIPIIVAYYKKNAFFAVTLSIVTLLYCYYVYEIDIIIMTIKFLCYFITYLFMKKKRLLEDNFINVIAVIQGFFITFEFFFKENNEFGMVFFELFMVVLIFYIVTFISIYLLKFADKITNLYGEIKSLEKEKILKDSLFKLTHEIKNPLAVCQGYLSMLDPNNKTKTNKYLPIIKQEISRSLNIMTDFMEYSKIKIKLEIVDINLLLEDVYDSFKILIDHKNINFKYIESCDEVYILGDYNRLKQVCLNMIKNAVEAINSKGEIILQSYLKKNDFYIEIIDDGCGMNEMQLDSIKDMFFTTKDNGTGIGVPLSNEIIKAHEGNINYYSKEKKGTKVVIKLPVVKE